MTDSWTTVASFSSSGEVHIVKGMLESHGIPVTMTNETISRVYPIDTWALVEIKVPAALAGKAKALIETYGG